MHARPFSKLFVADARHEMSISNFFLSFLTVVVVQTLMKIHIFPLIQAQYQIENLINFWKSIQNGSPSSNPRPKSFGVTCGKLI